MPLGGGVLPPYPRCFIQTHYFSLCEKQCGRHKCLCLVTSPLRSQCRLQTAASGTSCPVCPKFSSVSDKALVQQSLVHQVLPVAGTRKSLFDYICICKDRVVFTTLVLQLRKDWFSIFSFLFFRFPFPSF